MSAVWTQKNQFSDEMQLKRVDSFEFLFLAPTIISFRYLKWLNFLFVCFPIANYFSEANIRTPFSISDSWVTHIMLTSPFP